MLYSGTETSWMINGRPCDLISFSAAPRQSLGYLQAPILSRSANNTSQHTCIAAVLLYMLGCCCMLAQCFVVTALSTVCPGVLSKSTSYVSSSLALLSSCALARLMPACCNLYRVVLETTSIWHLLLIFRLFAEHCKALAHDQQPPSEPQSPHPPAPLP